MVQARIPEVGERVKFRERKLACALPGNVDLSGEPGEVVEIEDHGTTSDGYSHVDVWVRTNLWEDGKRLVVACTPPELEGMVIE
jgi:hypothetical protein